MIVHGSEGIAHVAALVRQSLLPKAADPYFATDVRMTAMLLDLISEDYERSVDVMWRDQREMKPLLLQAQPWLSEELRERVQRCLEEAQQEDLRVSVLSRHADRAMVIFIEVHASVEQAARQGRADARALENVVWRFIEDYTERRRYHADI
ncbi:hypothetical protein D3C71_1335070 [compost metagenome]